MLSIKQQIIQAIKQAKNILIVFKDIKYGNGYPAGGDAIASALALYGVLAKNNKNIDIASPNFSLPQGLAFLPNSKKIKDKIISQRQATISIDVKEAGIKDFSYKIENNYLNIYLTPKEGSFNFKNIKTDEGSLEYDLIISLDTPDLQFLGDTYIKNKMLFDNAPIINIDHNPQNDGYGDINLIDIKSSSTSEVIWHLVGNSKNLDENIIDCLLTGIIAKTKNFRRSNINPKTLEVVSQLINLGARREEIVDGLYRTKQVETLKLWGRTLARLKQNEKIIWSLLTRADFVHSGASEEALPDVIHELIANSSDTDIVVLFFENNDKKIKAFLYSEKHDLHLKSLKIQHSSNQLTCLELPHTNLIDAEKELVEEIKDSI
ncbi:bifunctional oligoribonuclease/PAP phosphatase NrnA [Patescibacteria group bacterium]